jgi:hypothetical protein
VHALSALHGQTQVRGGDGLHSATSETELGAEDSLQNLQRYEGQAERYAAPKRRKKKPVRKSGRGGSALTRLRPIRPAREKKMRHGPRRCSSTEKEIRQWQMDRASVHRLGKINNVRNEKSAAGTKSRPRAKDTEENCPNRTQQLDLLQS